MITKEQVQETAKNQGLTLTDLEIDNFVKEQKLPEKVDDDKTKLSKLNPEDLILIIKDLRKENAERRTKDKVLSDKVFLYETEDEKRKKKDLTDKGKHEEIIKQLEADKLTLTDKIKILEPEAENFKTYQTTKRESFKKQLGDKWKTYYDSMPLTDLEDLTADLTQKKPPGTFDKVGGAGGDVAKTSEEKLQSIYKS